MISVTICMNGMHSTRKIKERYPGYLPIIRELYTGFFNERYFNGASNVIGSNPLTRNLIGSGCLTAIIFILIGSLLNGFRKIAHNSTVKKMLNDVLYDQFMNDTSNDFIILGCRYMRIGSNYGFLICSIHLLIKMKAYISMGCIGNWTVEYTRFGKCAVFNPDAEQIGNVSLLQQMKNTKICVFRKRR